jgi:hypothetical protein
MWDIRHFSCFGGYVVGFDNNQIENDPRAEIWKF